jgi:hypothetical protein
MKGILKEDSTVNSLYRKKAHPTNLIKQSSIAGGYS